YVGGQLDKQETSLLAFMKTNPESFKIGYDQGVTPLFNGVMDEVRIWNRSLTQTEIQNIYNNETAGQYDPNMNRTGLVLELNMNVSSPDVATIDDTSGYGNDGTLYGTYGMNIDYFPLAKYSTECGSCSECSIKIQAASYGATIYLNQSITNAASTCINFNGTDNVTFDCKGFTIDGDNSNTIWGIYLNGSSDGNTIRNCNIQEFANGIRVTESSSSNNLINNTISTSTSSAGNGIWIQGDSKSNIIKNNTISTSGIASHGMYIITNADYNIVDNNTITTTGDEGDGIYLIASTQNVITNNTINTEDGYGVFLDTTSTNDYYNHTVTGNTEGGKLIYYYFDQDDVRLEDIDNIGELVVTVAENFTANNLTMDKDGILLYKVNNSRFENSTITTSGNWGHGIYLTTTVDYNNITNNTISTGGLYG
ncbi:MAG: right-handed parallel beta-helix repeat-containing protein, partial [Candidatus Peribacteraceae bacterium]|nr:right-handed parallel beta-helix repeat-containing protein [Candidatus Peribacteraceae bacterium]